MSKTEKQTKANILFVLIFAWKSLSESFTLRGNEVIVFESL